MKLIPNRKAQMVRFVSVSSQQWQTSHALFRFDKGGSRYCLMLKVVASTQHMLMDCVHVATTWHIIDQLGSAHWGDYVPLIYDQISTF